MTAPTANPAFPQAKNLPHETMPKPGLSDRAYIAAHALQGLLSNPQVWIGTEPEQRAKIAAREADLLLEALAGIDRVAEPVKA